MKEEAPSESRDQSPEERKALVDDIVEEIGDKKKLKVLATYGLGIFYTLFCGFVLGMLLTQARDKGLWTKLFGDADVQDVPHSRPVEESDELIAANDVFGAKLTSLTSHSDHSKALGERHIASIGLSGGKSLLSLQVFNYLETPLEISNSSGLVQVELADGSVHSSLALPDADGGSNAALRLKQRHPSGTIAPQSSRQFWVAFDQAISIQDIKKASLHLPSQPAIDFQ